MTDYLLLETGDFLLKEDSFKIILQVGSSPSASPSPSTSPSASIGYSLYSRAAKASLPTNDNDLDTLYTEGEEGQVETRDQIYVSQMGTLQYIIHQFKNFVGSQTYGLIQWEGKSSLAPSESAVFLQIYNQVTGLWETIDTDNTSDAEVNFELSAVVSNLTNYKDPKGIISCRVYQLAL